MIPLSFRRKVKWSEYGLVGAFFVSLFIEMYGFALCLLFIAKLFNWQVSRPENLVGFRMLGVSMAMDFPMTYACFIIVVGMVIIMIGWITLYRNVKKKVLATGGIYAYSRHPQYLGFIMVILGWIIGWPTIPTVVLGSILIYKYVKVCRNEESEMQAASPEYVKYMLMTPFMV
jgi:protein-S-isoprenylcysteine O-methyltransferase Ste14